MDYVEAATQLGTAIAESGELVEYRASETAVLADEKAQQLLSEFKDLQGKMVMASRDEMDKEGLEKIRDILLGKQEELNTYEVTKRYFDSRKGFETMMKNINSIIELYVSGGQEEGSCGGDCGGCSGCH